MKRFFRKLTFLCLIASTILSTRVTIASTPAPRGPDPACVNQCALVVFYECLLAGGRNGKNEQSCMSVYRQCIAQCPRN
jgi:hypothetical protein